MATEEGIVTELRPNGMAVVKTVQCEACKSCGSRESCHTAAGKDVLVEAVNTIDAGVGDRILLNLEAGSLLKATFLIYVFPILCLLAGAIAGQLLAPTLGIGPSESAALIGFGAFIISMVIMKINGDRMGRQDQYKPKIIRVLRNRPSQL